MARRLRCGGTTSERRLPGSQRPLAHAEARRPCDRDRPVPTRAWLGAVPRGLATCWPLAACHAGHRQHFMLLGDDVDVTKPA